MSKIENEAFAKKVLKFNKDLAKESIKVPEGFKIINPYKEGQFDTIQKVSTLFYKKYYNDDNKRRLILGSSPARRGTAVTGVPFEDAKHLQNTTGIFIDKFYVNKTSSDFLYDVMERYGGCEKFYSDFYMNFVCPLGIVRTNSKGNEVNCNYYENRQLQDALYPFIVDSIKKILSFGIDTSICYCIGSGENYTFLSKLNEKHKLFKKIIPLEHPRFIMQYNSKNKNNYLEKYLTSLNQK